MRTFQQMEMKVLQVIERASQQKVGDEDLLTELKEEFPDNHKRAARQLAALCNAARGQEVVWIIGINETTGEVKDLPSTDLQDWWPSVKKFFDEFSPAVANVIVPVNDHQRVVGLFFSTDRAPYVVSTGSEAGIEREIPWREGNRTRSARRHEILQLLSPAAHLPEVELLSCSLRVSRNPTLPSNSPSRESTPPRLNFSLGAELFVDVREPVTFPVHRLSVSVTIKGRTFQLKTGFAADTRADPQNSSVVHSFGALRVIYPDQIGIRGTEGLYAGIEELSTSLWSADHVSFEITLAVSGGIQIIPVSGTLDSKPTGLRPATRPTNDVNYEVNNWQLGE